MSAGDEFCEAPEPEILARAKRFYSYPADDDAAAAAARSVARPLRCCACTASPSSTVRAGRSERRAHCAGQRVRRASATTLALPVVDRARTSMREVGALRQAGLDVEVFADVRERDELLDAEARAFVGDTHYLLPIDAGRLRAYRRRLLRARPLGSLNTFAYTALHRYGALQASARGPAHLPPRALPRRSCAGARHHAPPRSVGEPERVHRLARRAHGGRALQRPGARLGGLLSRSIAFGAGRDTRARQVHRDQQPVQPRLHRADRAGAEVAYPFTSSTRDWTWRGSCRREAMSAGDAAADPQRRTAEPRRRASSICCTRWRWLRERGRASACVIVGGADRQRPRIRTGVGGTASAAGLGRCRQLRRRAAVRPRPAGVRAGGCVRDCPRSSPATAGGTSPRTR